MSISRHIYVAFLVASSSGCFGNAIEDGPRVGPESPKREVVVENWTGVAYRVYAYYNGDIHMIGTSRPMQSSTLRIPDSATGTVYLLTRELGTFEGRHSSEPIHVFLGQTVKWSLRATGGSEVNYMPPALTQQAQPGRMGR